MENQERVSATMKRTAINSAAADATAALYWKASIGDLAASGNKNANGDIKTSA